MLYAGDLPIFFINLWKIFFIMKKDWKEMKKLGRPKAIATPEKLWELACEYFEEIDDNPFTKEELIKGGMFAGDKGTINLKRPYTWDGFSVSLYTKGIISKIKDYKENTDCRYEDYQPIIRAIGEVIWAQKFEGAAVGIFNSNIIAREIGLSEKLEQSITLDQPLFTEVSTGKTLVVEESLLD